MDRPGRTVKKKRPRRTFTPKFKAGAVRLCRIGDRIIAQVDLAGSGNHYASEAIKSRG